MNNEIFVPMEIENSDVTRIILGNAQGKGARPYQEDSFGFSALDKKSVRKCGLTAVVSDGMGGLSDGDKVSRYTVTTIIEKLSSIDVSYQTLTQFTSLYNSISQHICTSRYNGGATASTVHCCKKGVFFCSTGDSRIYLYRKNRLYQMTTDFDYLNSLLNSVLSGDEYLDDALTDPQKDSLDEYIGAKKNLSPDINVKPFTPLKNDKLLICSDGVYNALDDIEIIESLSQSAQEAANDIQLKISYKQYENQDNFTAVILEFV
ncbi:MAG: serine/threonine-protein phosphatase [Oscillospiraceae bacterium]|nr:serine/threonine-protein phosphatase [Oscillospiraceae bacterium]